MPAFPPPDTLSKEDIRTIADVRRSIWTDGFTGLLYGSLTGYVLHTFAKLAHNRLPDPAKARLHAPGDTPLKFSRNTAFLSVMIGGAVGSFVMATAAGKNRVHELHSIYDAGKVPSALVTPEQAREKEINEFVRRKMSRRETMKKRLKEGHGLSDSHGGHWVEDYRPPQEGDGK